MSTALQPQQPIGPLLAEQHSKSRLTFENKTGILNGIYTKL